MLKLPYFNRERYILIKAYTFDRRVHKDKTFSMTSSAVGVLKGCPMGDGQDPGMDFTTCYGMTTSMNKSLTVSSWSEIRVEYQEDLNQSAYRAPEGNEVFNAINVTDTAYRMPPYSRMTKILCPWMMTCNKDINFVMSRHLMNKLPMHIQSGILHFEVTHAPHIFNAVYKGQNYKIPYKAPIAQLFPLSDLPLHLETYWDANMFEGLFNVRKNTPFFRGNAIKLLKKK